MSLNLVLLEASDDQEAEACRLLKTDPSCGFSQTRSDSLEHHEICSVILSDSKIVGFYSYRNSNDQLYYFFIAPEYRGKGVARSALRILVKRLQDRGVQKITINMQPEAELFWRNVLSDFRFVEECGTRYGIEISRQA